MADSPDRITEFLNDLTSEETVELTKQALQMMPDDLSQSTVVDWAKDANRLQELAAACQEADEDDEEGDADEPAEEEDLEEL